MRILDQAGSFGYFVFSGAGAWKGKTTRSQRSAICWNEAVSGISTVCFILHLLSFYWVQRLCSTEQDVVNGVNKLPLFVNVTSWGHVCCIDVKLPCTWHYVDVRCQFYALFVKTRQRAPCNNPLGRRLSGIQSFSTLYWKQKFLLLLEIESESASSSAESFSVNISICCLRNIITLSNMESKCFLKVS